ncbi:hypothetical protein GFC01_05850 [Desulfofundulus thermobenzoicus]|uniref:Uncharacterized protein n=1 Tax=Desulfofundulus thermobenzoicus TaxID=29376 RepID=A0A6N7IQC2_9FIRM|nr:hypothetical protein [Desulfofundulus thermobenzoicus]MQL51793.1 hypothetical protein [Desulfofundulus thermobenzoicus]
MQVILEPLADFSPAVKHGKGWCPYCGRETAFGWDFRLNVARCLGCGISERDFYVRKFNNLWPDGSLESYERSVKKAGLEYDAPFPWEKKKPKINIPERRQCECELCGKVVPAANNRQKYCSDCSLIARRKKERDRKRRVRHGCQPPLNKLRGLPWRGQGQLVD